MELTEDRVETRLESRAGIMGPLIPLDEHVELPLLMDMERMEGAMDDTVDILRRCGIGGETDGGEDR